MKYRICPKCKEIVVKTGVISSAAISSGDTAYFARCNNKDCKKIFSEQEFKKLKEIEF